MTANRGLRSFPGNFRSDLIDMQQVGTGTFANRPLPRFAGRFYYATDNGVLYVDTGSAWQSLSPRMVAHSETPVAINNTAAESDLANFTLAAGTMAAGDSLRFTFYGDVATNNAACAFQFKFRFGGSTLFTDAVGDTVTNSVAVRKPWMARITVTGVTATTQAAVGELYLTAAAAAANTWDFAGNGAIRLMVATSQAGAETLANTINVRFTTTMSAVPAVGIEAKLFAYQVEKLAA